MAANDSDEEIKVVDPKRVIKLEQEIQQLKALLSSTSVSPTSSTPVSPTKPTQLSLTKPRDVPMLDLDQLQGLDAEARLQIFVELVEQCSSQDDDRVRIAKSRVSSDLAILIHNNQANKKISSWPTLKTFLREEFNIEFNVDRAWQELESMTYDWVESPQAFTQRFKCQHAVVETRFPTEKFPNRDRTIKRKLWHGLPRESREKLEGFLEEGYPLNKFLERLEHERQILEAQRCDQVNMVPRENKKSSQEGAEAPAKSKSSELEELRESIQQLKAQVAPGRRETSRYHDPQPRGYCEYCRSNTHQLRECWRKPPRGHCFDCRRPGCYRGEKNCPARDRRVPPQQRPQKM